ncbi:hypothetical protein GMO_24390 [Gluconobacter morbifer G707]|uniref:Uncharacterized protein n=1 Tax=Gluconobacter morbifer G707 TaxID=1088869 RepID=G6XL16_9PROT|nr:hypothetical protein GMO_24390 [Gluconobacter morbifer G707]
MIMRHFPADCFSRLFLLVCLIVPSVGYAAGDCTGKACSGHVQTASDHEKTGSSSGETAQQWGHQTGRKLDRWGHKTGQDLGRWGQNTGHTLDRWGHQTASGMKNFFTGH